MAILDKITVAGFKSIRSLDNFELRNLNVLIGANGAGKSNFIGLFQLLSALMAKRLQLFVQEHDGPDAILFGGRKKTPVLHVELFFGNNAYEIELKPAGQRLIFQTENTKFFSLPYHLPHFLGTAHQEALLPDASDTFTRVAQKALASWRIYHFHDTSTSAAVRQAGAVRDNLLLKPDAGNLAAFLRRLRQAAS
ncbi:AAA family ATPase [uncultured Thiodictyon sp.]|uniref:AAA family ATPase n=1 Tax=uncultured Thiodictyon sp. TaxID=1846217 RepID=UPI0025E747D3|nr:AAA family ATPase [uncultured Thiodictyon sp.]